MPANLPPPYFEAEERFREARTPEAKIEALVEMLTLMPRHKGTDRLRADLRRRIARVRTEAQQRKGSGKRDAACVIEREGAVQAVLVGPPNTGKSSLVSLLTNAKPEVADYPHSTWKPTPGMAQYENIQFQLVDTPPISRERLEPWMVDLLRRTDLLALVLDIRADPLQQLEDTLLALQDVRIFPPGAAVPEDLRKAPFFKKMIILLNKTDEERELEDCEVFRELSGTPLPCLGISTRTARNLHEFLGRIYALSGILRAYSKAPGKEPQFDSPFVLPAGSTLEDLAAKIHKDFVSGLKFAKIWGKAVYDGRMVQRDYVLRDGDIVEMHI
ncbi:MAG: GTPase [Syntrophobacteraceae bacterium]|nr:50S ribosome-binding GTPase [Desulfobacteraceae bacterium]